MKTHDFGYPPRGMGYDRVDFIVKSKQKISSQSISHTIVRQHQNQNNNPKAILPIGRLPLPFPSDDEETNPLSQSFIGAEPTELEKPVSFQAFNTETSWYRPEPETQSTAPTSSRESYQTAPELSQPIKNLFNNLLKKNESMLNQAELQDLKQ